MNTRKTTLLVLAGLALISLAGQGLAQDQASQGKALFEDKCADCHRTSGLGLPPTFPALKGSALVQGPPAPLIQVVLKGRKGLATMPAWAPNLDDGQLAAILTYVRSAWGNQAPPVTSQQVAGQR
jgi:mono/diheme cytochrome c family protein